MVDERCQIIHGDNLTILRDIPTASVDIVYLDPPFFTQRVHTGRSGSFDDPWPSLAVYVGSIEQRAVELRRALRVSGLLYLHCDPTASHYLKIMLDGVFGPTQYVGSIVWKRTSAHSATSRKFACVHDTILVYGKARARRYGRRAGLIGDDVWTDIGLGSSAKERVGYPTQKPAALLDRIIAASCPPDGLVLDPYCGSGTTLVAALRLGRRAAGIDASADAVALAIERTRDVQAVL